MSVYKDAQVSGHATELGAGNQVTEVGGQKENPNETSGEQGKEIEKLDNVSAQETNHSSRNDKLENGTHSNGVHEISSSSETVTVADGLKLIAAIRDARHILPNWSGSVDFSSASMSTSEVHEIEVENDETVTKGEVKVEEYDLQKILDKQETHDLYCPNCNSCITRRVILKKRKRTVSPDARKEPRKRPQPIKPIDPPEVFRCLSCLTFFIPTVSFSYPNTNSEEVAMIISRSGSENGSTLFKPNATELTPDHMKRYGCKMIRALVSLMKTMDSKPNTEERTVLVCDDIASEDYEPPCAENEDINTWNKNPLKMEVGNVNSKHLVLAMKMKGIRYPCDDEMRVKDFDIDSDLSDTQVQLSGRRFGYVLCTSKKKFKFMLDSGATHHICYDEAIMRNLRKIKKEDRLPVYSSGGTELSAKRMGSIDLKDISLNPVGLIPSMQFNVVSVGQLANQGLMISCGNGQFSIYHMTENKIVGEGYLDNKLNEYVFKTLKWLPQVDKLIEISQNVDEENVELEAHKEWVIDTGCAQHLVPNASLLTNVINDKRAFQSAKGTIWSSHRGKFTAGKLVLKDVLCCKDIQDNLMSGPSLDKAGYRITFCGKTCKLVHKDGLELRGVANQNKSTNLYYLKTVGEEGEGKDNRVSAQGDTKEGKRRRLE